MGRVVMSDLKLIDELLCDLKGPERSWEDVERWSSVTRAAGRMPELTLGLAEYFVDKPVPGPMSTI